MFYQHREHGSAFNTVSNHIDRTCAFKELMRRRRNTRYFTGAQATLLPAPAFVYTRLRTSIGSAWALCSCQRITGISRCVSWKWVSELLSIGKQRGYWKRTGTWPDCVALNANRDAVSKASWRGVNEYFGTMHDWLLKEITSDEQTSYPGDSRWKLARGWAI